MIKLIGLTYKHYLVVKLIIYIKSTRIIMEEYIYIYTSRTQTSPHLLSQLKTPKYEYFILVIK